MPPSLPKTSTAWCRTAIAVAAGLALAACSSTSPSTKIEGVPDALPSIPLYGQSRTPPHHMAPGDYPFDANGNYVTSWAAQGAGSSSGATVSRTASHYDEDPPSRTTSRTSSPPTPSRSTTARAAPPPAPSKPRSSSTVATKRSSAPAKSSGRKHVVKSSDTLYSLAKRYGTTVDKIKKANGLTSDVLRNGRTLDIP